MDLEPSSINQIREAETGQFVEIGQDAGRVVEDLKRIDAGLGIRFSLTAREPFFALYHRSHDDCPHNGDVGANGTYLVKAWKAEQNRSGVWEGVDQRIVDRIMRIGHSSYDYVTELEREQDRFKRERKAELHENMGEMGEHAAHALRKDLGVRYRGRTFT